MQNSIAKQFADDPRVVVAELNSADPQAIVESFWRNVYLRTPVIYDPNGSVAQGQYAQPLTALPVCRGFVIGPDQTVVWPSFGESNDRIIATIYELLHEPWVVGDLNCDLVVGFGDINPFVVAMLGYDSYHFEYAECNWYNADCNGDGSVGFEDINPFVRLLAGA